MSAPERPGRLLWNVVWKGLLLFLVFNLLFAAFPPRLGKVSAYNRLFPGRARFPFGENPTQSYNLSLYDVDAMFASHEIAALKPAGEFRVLVVGDSSVWGTLLRPEQTLSAYLTAALADNRCGLPVKVYNLGYPTLSLTKDLMIIDRAMEYQPDLIIWMVTLESFARAKQLESPIVANNPGIVSDLAERYNLSLAPRFEGTWLDRTIVGQRRALADWTRLQLYGVMWAATGVDQFYPETYQPAARDLDPDPAWQGLEPDELPVDALALDVLGAGMRAAGDVPVLLVNEPMLISNGENRDVRYNFFYPRWAYDQYRQILSALSEQLGWNYLDLWRLVPQSEFTNSAIHLTPAGEQQLAAEIAPVVEQEACWFED